MILDETGGLHGVRHLNLLQSAAELPKQAAFGSELYPDAHTKAAVYARSIIMNHPFVDGNKRTGITTALIFLADNGHEDLTKESEVEKFAVQIVKKRLTVEQIAAWLKKKTS